MGSSLAGSSAGTFSWGMMGMVGGDRGAPTLHHIQPLPIGAPSTYLLIHQFRLHLARQPGGTQSPGGRVGVSGSPNWEQKLALFGVFWAFEGRHRKQISLGTDRTHWVSLSMITGATGITPATPKGGSRPLVSKDFEIPQVPTPMLSSHLSVVAALPPCRPLAPTLPPFWRHPFSEL